MKYRKGSWNLLIAFVIISIISILQWNRWGLRILQELDDGNFFFLGGPSLWYPTALFPSLVAIGYLISFLCSLGRVEILRGHEYLDINEKKGFIIQKVTVPLNTITSISISNTKLGWNALGVIPLILSSYYLYNDGISLISYHAAFGFGIDTGFYYILQASGNIIAILLVLYMSPGEIIIRSSHIDRVVVQIPIIWIKPSKILMHKQIIKELEIAIHKPFTRKSIEDLILIIYGFILISISIISRVFLMFSNEILRLIYIFVGILFITVGVKNYPGEKWLWFSFPQNLISDIKYLICIYCLSGVVVLSTTLSVINNLIYISQSVNILLSILLNLVPSIIVISPGVWILLRSVIRARKTKDLIRGVP